LEETTSADKLIWGVPVDYQRTQEDFAVIIEHLLITLTDYLQQPIEHIDASIEKSILGEKKFLCYLRSETEFGDVFKFG
jgi:hypothetical protein